MFSKKLKTFCFSRLVLLCGAGIFIFSVWNHFDYLLPTTDKGIQLIEDDEYAELITESYSTNLSEPVTWDNFVIKFADLNETYQMVLPNTNCTFYSETQPKIFVFVPVHPSAVDKLDKIRSSWASSNITTKYNVVMKFIVGFTNDTILQEQLFEQFHSKGDLIINNITEDYKRLFLKIYAAFQWQQRYCSTADYILKTDSDTVIDLARLSFWIENKFDEIAKNHSSAAEFGGRWIGVIPRRNPKDKWFVPRAAFPSLRYPPYLNGPTYLLTNEAVSRILSIASRIRHFTVEDILYTGVIAKEAKIFLHPSWKHFQNIKKVTKVKECASVNGTAVPLLLALYSFNFDQLAKAFDELRNIKCK